LLGDKSENNAMMIMSSLFNAVCIFLMQRKCLNSLVMSRA